MGALIPASYPGQFKWQAETYNVSETQFHMPRREHLIDPAVDTWSNQQWQKGREWVVNGLSRE